MKIKRILAIGCAAIMALGLAACSANGGSDKGTTAAAEGTYSVDFEDGNSAFVLPCTMIKAYDNSAISVQEINGSKVCYAANQGGATMMVGIDAASLLGDNITKVASMKITIGTKYSDNSFSASSGTVYAYFGESNTQGKAGTWSIYMEDKNPTEYTFDLAAAGVTFTAGAKNYIVVAKETDNGKVVGDLFIDNIAFLDADGNVLEADTSATFDPVDGYVGSFEEETDPNVVVIDTINYNGGSGYSDWSAAECIVDLETLQQFKDGITIQVDYTLPAGYDYAMFAPINYNGWAKLPIVEGDQWKAMTSSEASDAGLAVFLQTDGYIVLSGGSASEVTSVTFDLSAETMATLVEEFTENEWGGLAFQVYGVEIYQFKLSAPGAAAASGDKIVIDEIFYHDGSTNYSDWAGVQGIVDLEYLEKCVNGATVKVDYLLPAGYEYAMFAPINWNGWAKLPVVEGDQWKAMSSSEATDAGLEIFLQSDGYIVIPGGSAGTVTSATFDLSAETMATLVEEFKANEWGGFGFQVYGVNIYEITVTPKSAE